MYIIYIQLYITSLPPSPLLTLSLSLFQFHFRCSTIRSSINTSVYCSFLSSRTFILLEKKLELGVREATTVLQRFLFLLRDFRRFISGQEKSRRSDRVFSLPHDYFVQIPYIPVTQSYAEYRGFSTLMTKMPIKLYYQKDLHRLIGLSRNI